MEERNICNNCGTENPPGSKFCVSCGGKIVPQPDKQNLCPNCGTPLAEGAKFCNECGTRTGEPVPPRHEHETVENGLFHDHTFGSDVQPDYDQRPADRSPEPPSMAGYYREEKERRKQEKHPQKAKKEKAPREARSGSKAVIIPIILFIIAGISAFYVRWEITVAIAVIAVVVLIVVIIKRKPKKPVYDEMGY